MKIIQLKAENIKRLIDVDITPAGNLVQITGKNGGMGISPENDALPPSYAGKRMFRGYEAAWSEQEPLPCIVPNWLDAIREMAGLTEQPQE